VKRKAKSLGKCAAQLEGALALFGGNVSVAGYDNAAFTHRAGELIARVAENGRQASAKAGPKKDGDARR